MNRVWGRCTVTDQEVWVRVQSSEIRPGTVEIMLGDGTDGAAVRLDTSQADQLIRGLTAARTQALLAAARARGDGT